MIQRHFLWIAVLALFLSSCTTLDTFNKKLYAFETTYDEFLTTVIDLTKQGIINGEFKASLQGKVKELKKARLDIYNARAISEALAMEKLTFARSLLNTLRQELRKKEAARGP